MCVPLAAIRVVAEWLRVGWAKLKRNHSRNAATHLCEKLSAVNGTKLILVELENDDVSDGLLFRHFQSGEEKK